MKNPHAISGDVEKEAHHLAAKDGMKKLKTTSIEERREASKKSKARVFSTHLYFPLRHMVLSRKILKLLLRKSQIVYVIHTVPREACFCTCMRRHTHNVCNFCVQFTACLNHSISTFYFLYISCKE